MAQNGTGGRRKQKRRAGGVGLGAASLNGPATLPPASLSPDGSLLAVLGPSADAQVIRIVDARTGSLVCAYSPGRAVQPLIPGNEQQGDNFGRWKTFSRMTWVAAPGQKTTARGADPNPSKKSRKRTRSSSPPPSSASLAAPPAPLLLLIPTPVSSLGPSPALVFSPSENRVISSLPADPPAPSRPAETPDVVDACSPWSPGEPDATSSQSPHMAYVLDSLGRVVEWNLTDPAAPKRTGRGCVSKVKSPVRVAVGRYSADSSNSDDDDGEGMEVDSKEPVTVVAVAGSALEVWRVGSADDEEPKLVKNLPGHPSPITSLTFHPDPSAGLLISCAESDPSVAATIWHLERGAVGALPTPSPPKSITLHHPTATAILHLASGSITVHPPFPALPPPKPGSVFKPLRISPSATLDHSCLTTLFPPSADPSHILVVIGYPASTFHRVALRTATGAWVSSLPVPEISSGVSEHSAPGVAPKQKYGEAGASVAGAGGDKGYADNVGGGGEEERSLAERVKAMAIAAGSEARSGASGSSATALVSSNPAPVPLVAGTLLAPIQQALRTSDMALLDSILATRDTRVVRATVARMTATEVGKLVERIVERVAKGGRWDGYVGWIEEAAASCVGAPSAPPAAPLSRLHSLLESRVSTYHKLLRLRGRLDAMVSRMPVNAPPVQDAVEEEALGEAAVVYREEDDVQGDSEEGDDGDDGAESDDDSDDDDDDVDDDEDDGDDDSEEGDDERDADYQFAEGDAEDEDD
ncbi:hypothetical protein M427DRAFT_75627 [Gonapodya prolifera JEL478]|uniref:Uncharacterized protein n=1 Tax=Gonapodya prolifera (strain JEL478) TaxID=1344416 RepID=A0A138ZXX3_GONPJ|nr:hypothetical protein M427DRAFT_75627 [Gonapodya prolifera JEL478]|eukprot:KXS09352.1 hypothetical protein M427DRAFT_75627 [Gonapodya prolifera JEL478]